MNDIISELEIRSFPSLGFILSKPMKTIRIPPNFTIAFSGLMVFQPSAPQHVGKNTYTAHIDLNVLESLAFFLVYRASTISSQDLETTS